MLPRNFNRAELSQVRREPLRVKQGKFSRAQMFDQRHQSDLRRVPDPVKHRFAEKGTADADAVKSPGQFAFAPRFDRMCVTKLVQLLVALDDLAIDPGVVAFGASANDFA